MIFKKTFRWILPWFTEVYKNKLPCISQATNEIMFFVLVAYKTAETIFLSYIYIEIRARNARNACGYDVIRETAKS